MKALVSPISVGVPGLYSMLADVHNKNGNLKWETFLQMQFITQSHLRYLQDLTKCYHGHLILKMMNILKKYILKIMSLKKIGSIVNNIKLKSLNIISRNGYSINNGKIANLIQNDLHPIYY